jgi:hypothetical protein
VTVCRMRVGIRFFVAFLLVLATQAALAAMPADVREGDIIFHTSRSAQSLSIQKATHSPYSHMGIVFFRGGKPFVFEAVSTVRYTPLDAWIARGERGRFVLKRLKTSLTNEQVKKLRDAAPGLAGKPYDLTFEWSDSRIYCSELVWKLYDRALGIQIGKLQKLREFDLSDPTVWKMMKQRYGSEVPMNEPVISPAAMFESTLLVNASGTPRT